MYLRGLSFLFCLLVSAVAQADQEGTYILTYPDRLEVWHSTGISTQAGAQRILQLKRSSITFDQAVSGVSFAGNLTLAYGATLGQGSNNVVSFTENSEDLTLTFASNLVTLNSTTSATIKITPSLQLDGVTYFGTHTGIDPTTGGLSVAPYATPAFYADIGVGVFDAHYLLQGFSAEGPQFSFTQAYNYGAGLVNPRFLVGRVFKDPALGVMEWRILHADDDTAEHNIFVVEETGTVASVSDGTRRSQFEWWLVTGDTKPCGRLSSYPSSGFDLGACGTTETDVGMHRTAAGILTLDNGIAASNGAVLEFNEITAPTAPTAASGNARLYVETSGGKQRMCVLFDSGATQCFATEP